MPLNDAKLITDFEDFYELMQNVTDKAEGKRQYARRQAKIIGDYVRSGLVQTQGTATTQTGTIQ